MAKSPINTKQGRYEIREILGEGGMGVVYRAFDPVLKREVTLKTVRDPQDKTVLDLFRRECAVLAGMAHPNIVEIFDIGETDEATGRQPYFVMPLLKGMTLDQLIRGSSPRLTVDRGVQMIAQACRGLQAAHDQGLVHRDLKPGNLFVLEDDSVKIIDFGVAHLTDQHSQTGLKGTLLYMSPEQIQMKKPAPLSDQFSIAVIAYEMLTGRHPFTTAGREDLVQAILQHSPPPATDINGLVPPAVSQVIHKALAKEPFHRFANVREFADCMQKAFRGEAIDFFDPNKIEPRLIRARKAFEGGDLDFAAEIIRELQSESYLSPEIDKLDRQIATTIRNKNIRQLLDTARRRFDEQEYVLALQKVQEVLTLDPQNTDAFTLKGSIESKRGATQIEEWSRLAQQHMDNHAYTHARQALEKVLELRPKDSHAEAMLGEVNRREQEYTRIRSQKKQAYESAIEAYERGDVNSALSRLEGVLDLDRQTPFNTSTDQAPVYQKFYEEVRSKRDQLRSQEVEARKQISDGNFTAAFTICDEVLKGYPNNVVFRVLRDDAEQAQRQEISAFVANVEKDISKEPDLNRRVAILEDAQKKYSHETRFEQLLQQVRSRKGLVDSIIAKAQALEDSGQFSEALQQWEVLRDIHPQQPGLDVESQRLKRRREDQMRDGAKGSWIAQIDQAVTLRNYTKALSLVNEAFAEFPGDPELQALERSSRQAVERQKEAAQKIAEAREADAMDRTDDGIAILREAYAMDAQYPPVRAALLELLLKRAGGLLDSDWVAAEPLIKEAMDLESANPLAKSLRTLVQDKKQSAEVAQILSRARELQGEEKIQEALTELTQGLSVYPKDTRLHQLRSALDQTLAQTQAMQRPNDADETVVIDNKSQGPSADTIFQHTGVYTSYGQGEPIAPEPVAAPLPPNPAVTMQTPAKVAPFANPKFWMALAAAAVVTFAVLFGASRFLGRSGPATVKTVEVTVNNASGGAIQVRDAKGQDVTEAWRTVGLPAGSYKMTAVRPGFNPVEVPLTLVPDQLTQAVELNWQALPSKLVVRGASANSSLRIGDNEQKLTGPEEVAFDLLNGVNTIRWNSPFGDGLDVDITVNNGKASILNWTRRPTATALVTLSDSEEVKCETVNLPLGVTVNGTAFPTCGKLPITVRQAFEVHGADNSPLTKFDATDSGHSAAVYLDFVARPAPAPKRPAAVPVPAAAPAPAPKAAAPVAAPVPAAPAGPTPEELKLEEMRKRLERRSGGAGKQ